MSVVGLCIKREDIYEALPTLKINNFTTVSSNFTKKRLYYITMSNNIDADAEVFEYTGEGCVVPTDVTIVRFHPSVVEVEEEALEDCTKLREAIFNN